MQNINNIRIKSDNTTCCVPQCNSRGSKDPDLSFHSFPPEKRLWLRNEWIKILNIKKEVTRRMRVCSKHFNPNDYFHPSAPTKFPRLRVNTKPSLHLPLSTSEDDKNTERVSQQPVIHSFPTQNQNPLCNQIETTDYAQKGFKDDAAPSVFAFPGNPHLLLVKRTLTLEKDVENYMQYKLQGGKIFLKKDAIPHKFECQKSNLPPKNTKKNKGKAARKILQRPTTAKEDPTSDEETTSAEETPTPLDEDSSLEDKKGDFDALYPTQNEDMILPDVEERVSSTALMPAGYAAKRTASSSEDFPMLKVIKQEVPDESSSASDFYEYPNPDNYDANLTVNSEDQFDKFGKHVACQLRELPLRNALILQEAIQSLITKERIACLPSDSVLS